MLVKENGWELFGGLFIMFIWYAITFLIYFDISFDFEMKRKKKKAYLLQEEKKRKNLQYAIPPGIKPWPTDSVSEVLTTVLSRHLT